MSLPECINGPYELVLIRLTTSPTVSCFFSLSQLSLIHSRKLLGGSNTTSPQLPSSTSPSLQTGFTSQHIVKESFRYSRLQKESFKDTHITFTVCKDTLSHQSGLCVQSAELTSKQRVPIGPWGFDRRCLCLLNHAHLESKDNIVEIRNNETAWRSLRAAAPLILKSLIVTICRMYFIPCVRETPAAWREQTNGVWECCTSWSYDPDDRRYSVPLLQSVITHIHINAHLKI